MKIATKHFAGKPPMQAISRTIAAAVLAIALAAICRAGDEKLSPELRSRIAGPDVEVEVIVQYRAVPTEAHRQRAAALGAKLHARMDLVKSAHYTISQSRLSDLANDPEVTYVSPNRPLKGSLNITAATVHSDVARTQGYTGTGIGVAVIDSGVADMPEFHANQSRIVYQQSFVPNVPALNMACADGAARLGAWYSDSLDLQGGIAPYTVSITSGSLPDGLSLNRSTGNITGVPVGATNGPPLVYTATVVDSWGNTASQKCNINIEKAHANNPPPFGVTCPAGGAQAQAWYNALLPAQGGVPPYSFSISSGHLPSGLSLDPSSGAITGTPVLTISAISQPAFTIAMKDAAANSTSQSCSLSVGPAQNQITSAADQYGHGSHVAGIVASSGSGTVYIGIAPGVNIVNLRALDQNGNGSDASVIQAIDAAISLAHTYNIRVINLSLGRQVYEPAAQDPLCQAVEAAWKAGIVVVVAAGNDGRDNSAGTQGYGTITAPGNDPYVITVGAMKSEATTTRSDDLIASYSSKGPTAFDFFAKPDIVAPGNRIVSTMSLGETLDEEYGRSNRVDGDFFTLSGTSMATPVVSGAAALLLQKYPSLTPDQVKARLMKNATKNFPASSTAVEPTTGVAYTSYYDIFTIGAGYLDITAALADTTVTSGTALSPATACDPATGDVSLQGIGDAHVIWGTANWATHVIWGSNVSDNHVIWGTHVIWGSGTVFDTHVIWGTTVVWDESTSETAQSTAVTIVGEP